MRRYLQQALDESVPFDASVEQLEALFQPATDPRAAPPAPRRILRPAAAGQGGNP